MEGNRWIIAFVLGLVLALLWFLAGWSRPAVAAPGDEPALSAAESASVPAAELHVYPSGCTYSSISHCRALFTSLSSSS